MQKYSGLILEGPFKSHFCMSYSGVWTTGRYVERVERHAAVKPESINQCTICHLTNLEPIGDF